MNEARAESIVLNIKPKKSRSPAQLEALKKAQDTRREKLQARASKKDEPEPPPPPVPAKPVKDYRALFKAQRAELSELRFERALHERMILEGISNAPAPPTPAPEPAPAVSAKPAGLGPGWMIGAPVRKKNLQW